ncbi:hypothetical protein HYW17_02035 [Candidatus Uhrbacteria bacterium]|nr:hypothetical protein [Candidatus Uhrbacteria bacterium]
MNYELRIMNIRRSILRGHGESISRFFLLLTPYSLFLILTLALPAQAQSLPQLKTFCFTQDECVSPPYSGEAKEAPECRDQDPRYVQAGYLYNCYAKQQPIRLEVGIGPYKVAGIEDYIRRLYIYLIGISGIVVGVMYTWAGLKWLTSGGAPDRITDAKKKIGNATVGLVLLLSSYLILQTVNPALVRLRLPALKMPRQVLLGDDLCVNRPEYPCGGLKLRPSLSQDGLGQWQVALLDPLLRDRKYQCDDPSNADLARNPPCQDGVGSGACVPRFCPFPGCYTLLEDRITEDAQDVIEGIDEYQEARDAGLNVPTGTSDAEVLELITTFREQASQNQRMCVKPEQCGGCAANTPWAVCVSSACPCILDVKEIGGEDQIVCAGRRGEGQPCERHEQCQGQGQGGRAGRCNFGRIPNECTPEGGEPPGQPCDVDGDCASGLCNENAATDVCVAPQSLRIGEDCSSSEECVTGVCGYEGVISTLNPASDPVCMAAGQCNGLTRVGCPCETSINCNTNTGD